MRLGRDGIAGLIGLAVSLGLLPHALGLPKLPIVPVGPGFYPTIVLIFMAVTSARSLLQDVLARSGRRRRPMAERRRSAAARLWPRRGGIRGGCRIHRAAAAHRIPPGYGAVRGRHSRWCWSGRRRRARGRFWSPIAVGTSAVTYAVFNHYLLVLLPRGAWTGW